jgi:hypothetical protein
MGMTRLIIGFAAALAAHGQVEDKQMVTRRFALTGGAQPELVAGVLHGGIAVTTHEANEIVLTAAIQLKAADAAALQALKQRVRLESEQRANNVWIGVEMDAAREGGRQREFGWRGNAQTGAGKNGASGARFRHDLEIRVPRLTHVKLSAVHEGGVSVDGVEGEFRVSNVNGPVDIGGARAHGRAQSVNGPIRVAFAANPGGPLTCKTVNGRVQVLLQPDINASLKLKTLNGGVYSDFPILAAVATAVRREERGGRRVWRIGGFSEARIGSGGQEISIETVNGAIHILQNK